MEKSLFQQLIAVTMKNEIPLKGELLQRLIPQSGDYTIE